MQRMTKKLMKTMTVQGLADVRLMADKQWARWSSGATMSFDRDHKLMCVREAGRAHDAVEAIDREIAMRFEIYPASYPCNIQYEASKRA